MSIKTKVGVGEDVDVLIGPGFDFNMFLSVEDFKVDKFYFALVVPDKSAIYTSEAFDSEAEAESNSISRMKTMQNRKKLH